MYKKYLLIIIGLFVLTLPVYAIEQEGMGPDDDAVKQEVRNEAKEQEISEKRQNLKAKAEEKKAQSLSQTKTKANKIIEKAIKKLEKMKTRLTTIKNLTTEQKTELSTKIDARIAFLKEKQAAIEQATTKEEVRAAIAEGVKEIRSTKDILKSLLEAIHKTQLSNVITRFEALVTKLESKISKLDEERQVIAKEAIAQAKSYVSQAKTSLDANDIKSAKEYLRKAHKSLSQAVGEKNGLEKESTEKKEGGSNDNN